MKKIVCHNLSKFKDTIKEMNVKGKDSKFKMKIIKN